MRERGLGKNLRPATEGRPRALGDLRDSPNLTFVENLEVLLLGSPPVRQVVHTKPL